jgi:hypothetical protein
VLNSQLWLARDSRVGGGTLRAVPYTESGLCTPNILYRDEGGWFGLLMVSMFLLVRDRTMTTITPKEQYL